MGHDGGSAADGPTGLMVIMDKGTDMRVVVDYDLCESNAVCMGIAPDIFEVRDDDFLYVLDETPPESSRAKLEEAVQRCPKQAISIAED